MRRTRWTHRGLGHAVAIGNTRNPPPFTVFFTFLWLEEDPVKFIDILLAEPTQIDNQARIGLGPNITV